MALKLAYVITIHKTDKKNIMKNYRPVGLLPIVPNYLRTLCTNKLVPMLKISFLLIYFVSGQDLLGAT